MGIKKSADKPNRLLAKLFAAGFLGQLGAYGLSYFANSLSPDYGILSFDTFIVALPVMALAGAAVVRPPNWATLGATTAIAELAGLFCYADIYSQDLALTVFFALGAGSIFGLAFWTDHRVSARLGRLPSFFITAISVTAIWLAAAWAGTTVIVNLQTLVENQRVQTELNSRLAALDFKPYLPISLPAGYSIQKIVPISQLDVETFKSPRSLTFWLEPAAANLGITLSEFSVPTGFNPPTECGPYDAGSLSIGPEQSPLPCQPFTQAGAVAVYFESPDYVFPTEYHFYLRLDMTEVTISTHVNLSPDQLQHLVNGLRLTSPSSLPADRLQEN